MTGAHPRVGTSRLILSPLIYNIWGFSLHTPQKDTLLYLAEPIRLALKTD